MLLREALLVLHAHYSLRNRVINNLASFLSTRFEQLTSMKPLCHQETLAILPAYGRPQITRTRSRKLAIMPEQCSLRDISRSLSDAPQSVMSIAGDVSSVMSSSRYSTKYERFMALVQLQNVAVNDPVVILNASQSSPDSDNARLCWVVRMVPSANFETR
jgi:hypothetical protein